MEHSHLLESLKRACLTSQKVYRYPVNFSAILILIFRTLWLWVNHLLVALTAPCKHPLQVKPDSLCQLRNPSTRDPLLDRKSKDSLLDKPKSLLSQAVQVSKHQVSWSKLLRKMQTMTWMTVHTIHLSKNRALNNLIRSWKWWKPNKCKEFFRLVI